MYLRFSDSIAVKDLFCFSFDTLRTIEEFPEFYGRFCSTQE